MWNHVPPGGYGGMLPSLKFTCSEVASGGPKCWKLAIPSLRMGESQPPFRMKPCRVIHDMKLPTPLADYTNIVVSGFLYTGLYASDFIKCCVDQSECTQASQESQTTPQYYY